MNTRISIYLAPLLAIAALWVVAEGAQAATQTLVSGEADSLCVNPKAFKPTVKGKVNYVPLEKAHNGPFPTKASSCAPESPEHPAAMGGPGEPAGPFTASIPGASWVSINPLGEDASNPPPRYYLYTATFTLPCGNQVAGSELNLAMFADDTAGAFLNGASIGHLTYPATEANFNGPPVGGWPLGPAVGAAGGFRAGGNSLQFVVLDESPSSTALDFSAALKSPPCEPRWYSNGQLITGEVPVGSAGSVLFLGLLPVGSKKELIEFQIKCNLYEQTRLENPVDGPGASEVTEFALSDCKSRKEGSFSGPCPRDSELNLTANNLNWPGHLTAGPPIRDVSEDVEVTVKCNRTAVWTFTGTLTEALARGGAVDLGGELSSSGSPLGVSGKESMEGPPGDEKITTG